MSRGERIIRASNRQNVGKIQASDVFDAMKDVFCRRQDQNITMIEPKTENDTEKSIPSNQLNIRDFIRRKRRTTQV